MEGRKSAYRILYRPSAAWEVPGAGLPYPGDYEGIVVAVKPEAHVFTPGDLGELGSAGGSGARRAVLTLELTEEEAADLASRRRKINVLHLNTSPGDLEASRCVADVSFDDRWGAVAAELRRRFGEAAEALEREQETLGEGSPSPGASVQAAGMELARLLPRNVAHTGAGLYEVGPGKTYTTIQSALDQLWTDQGGVNFTAVQEIRVYDGTYTEAVAVNASLLPTPNYYLAIKAASGNNAVVLTNSGLGAVHTLELNYAESTLVQGFEIRNVSGNVSIRAIAHLGYNNRIKSMSIQGGGTNTKGLYCSAARCSLVEDCVIQGFASSGVDNASAVEFRHCRFVSPCTVELAARGSASFRGCTFSGANAYIYPYSDQANPHDARPTEILNCIFYGNNYAVAYSGAHSWLNFRIRNSIFHTVGTAISIAGAFALVDSDCNTFYNCAKIAAIGGVNYTALADWRALVDADGRSPDAHSLSSDPKLHAPGNDDFSLDSDSPCRHAGVGATVATDWLGTVFDPRFPDIGAWSSGLLAAVGGPPAIASVAATASAVTATLAGEAGATYRVRLMSRDGTEEDEQQRTGPGAVELAPAAAGIKRLVAWTVSGDSRSEPSAPEEVFVSSGPGPFEEVRSAVVARLRAHAGLAALLGTDESGAVPIYAAGPAAGRVAPCVVHTLEGSPDAMLDRAGRWRMELTLEAWGGSPGVNDGVVEAADEVFEDGRFECTDWSVKVIRRTGERTRWTDDGRTEIRRTTWALVVDRR